MVSALCERVTKNTPRGESFTNGPLEFNDIIENDSARITARRRKQKSCAVTQRLVLYNSQLQHIYHDQVAAIYSVLKDTCTKSSINVHSKSFEKTFDLLNNCRHPLSKPPPNT